jgi:starch-binding outer membrane protein, SusD/RagB family
MRRLFRTAAAVLLASAAAAGATACSDFLEADAAIADPNLPSAATRDQLFTGAQANIFAQQEGPVAMIACQWMQQCSGVNGRFVETQDAYDINNTDFDLPFQEIYSAGGLLSLRAVQASADAEGNKVYKGAAEVLEALLIGTTADVWGNIPYSEAVGDVTTPAFDDQMAVYDAVQALLDRAIADLGAAGSGPGAVDLFYGGDKAKWIQAARTLKARYYLHTVERLGNAQYQKAIDAATAGISTAANDLRTAHSTATSERNMWVQFQATSFGPDLVAGKRLVDLMLAQNDRRLADYFDHNEKGAYGGNDVTTGSTPGGDISPIGGTRHADDFRQPLVTWEENQLILAEANFVLRGAAAAQPFLDAVRTANGKASRPATLQSIMEEKYVALFQNLEVWSDWKRTCLPTLTPARGRSAIPGRLYYGATEEQTNPNTPASSAQNLFTVRNPNDPRGC